MRLLRPITRNGVQVGEAERQVRVAGEQRRAGAAAPSVHGPLVGFLGGLGEGRGERRQRREQAAGGEGGVPLVRVARGVWGDGHGSDGHRGGG